MEYLGFVGFIYVNKLYIIDIKSLPNVLNKNIFSQTILVLVFWL